MDITQRVEMLRKTVKQNEEMKNKLEGQLEMLNKELYEKFQVDTLKDAEVLLDAMKEELVTAQGDIESRLSTIEKELATVAN